MKKDYQKCELNVNMEPTKTVTRLRTLHFRERIITEMAQVSTASIITMYKFS